MSNEMTRHADQMLVPGTFPWAEAALRSGAYSKWKRPDEMLLAVSYGAEVGLGPNASLNQIGVINGKVSLHSGGLLALALGSGKLRSHKVTWSGEEDTDEWTCLVQVGRDGIETLFEGEFSVKDAKRAQLWGKRGPWSQYPKRMMMARAETYALRSGFADIIAGLTSAEEAGDYQLLPGERAPAPEPKIEAEFEVNVDPWNDPNWSGEVDFRTKIPIGSLANKEWRACRPEDIEALQKMVDYGEQKGLPWWVRHAGQVLQQIDEQLMASEEVEAKRQQFTPDQQAQLEQAHANDQAVLIEPPKHDRKDHYASRAKARLKQLVKFLKPRAVSRDHEGDIGKLTIATGNALGAWINEQWGELVIPRDGFKAWWSQVSHEHLTAIKSFLVEAGADVEGK